VAGPEWRSFEQFRVAGAAALESLGPGAVATLQAKCGTFRILRDDDFQRLLGLATEVHRLKQGLTIVLTAARIVAKHPNDPDGIELLCKSASFLNESSVLPERDGHETFQITAEEAGETREEDLDLSAIRRPAL
jgi:hypothetical protein